MENKKYKFIILNILLVFILIIAEKYQGHTFLSQSGNLFLWLGDLGGAEVSQHLMDWYSYSHFIHGILFYLFLTFIFEKFNFVFFQKYFENFGFEYFVRRFSPRAAGENGSSLNLENIKLSLAIFLETFWEILENSPIIINRYREGALAAGYFGDSIINSLSDLGFMFLGYLFVRKFGWKISLCLVVFLELLTLYFIRDNLILNIIMLIHPFTAISNWQVM